MKGKKLTKKTLNTKKKNTKYKDAILDATFLAPKMRTHLGTESFRVLHVKKREMRSIK